MDYLAAVPSPVFIGLGVIGMFYLSWWWLMRGFLHTDNEFQGVVTLYERSEARHEKKDETIAELLSQNRVLIDANATTAHVVEGLRLALEAKS